MGLFKKSCLIRTDVSVRELKRLFIKEFYTFNRDGFEDKYYYLDYQSVNGPYSVSSYGGEFETVIEIRSDKESTILELSTQFSSENRLLFSRMAKGFGVYGVILALLILRCMAPDASAETISFVKLLTAPLLIFLSLTVIKVVHMFFYSSIDKEASFVIPMILKISSGEIFDSTHKTSDEVVLKNRVPQSRKANRKKKR